MKSASRSPLYPPTLVLAVVGAALPLISLLRSGGVRGFLDGAGLLLVVWGLSPFLLFPIAARLARRGWVRRMVLVLAAVAVLFGRHKHRQCPAEEGHRPLPDREEEV